MRQRTGVNIEVKHHEVSCASLDIDRQTDFLVYYRVVSLTEHASFARLLVMLGHVMTSAIYFQHVTGVEDATS